MDWCESQKPFVNWSAFMLALALFGATRWVYILPLYILFYVITNSEHLYRTYLTLPRDIRGLVILLTTRYYMQKRLRENRPLHELFLEVVRRHPNKEAVIEVGTGRRLTFEQFNALANRYAHFFQEEGLADGDVVSLFMENSADFVALWLGLSKLGIVSAWINFHLKLEPLSHSLIKSKSKAVVTTSSLLPTLMSAMEANNLCRCKVYLLDDPSEVTADAICIRDEVSIQPSHEPVSPPSLNFSSVLCYIYTSGTTGNPKPAIIKHFRFYMFAMGCGIVFGIKPEDRLYIMMPLYHSAAGLTCIGNTVFQGCTAVIRSRFSASNFWKDCIKYECTVSQYIGEICRYLLAQKETPEDKLHKVRLMYGNGLRAEIWTEFVNRFNIRKIGEVYGSTEGTSNLVNIDNRVGACGFFPIHSFLNPLYPVRLLKVDRETGEILRGQDGLCIPCRPGETGEAVSVIKDNDTLLRFEGYADREDTKKKILRNALRKGDAVFCSGDLLRWDELGYFHFVDRQGDTFRWKGENVSTTEVEGVLQPLKSVANVTVYGVHVPKCEGRAGMAAVVPQNGVPHEELMSEIARRLSESLSVYAIPLFLRLCDRADITGTFKLKKVNLQRDGFDLERCHNDPVYCWDSSRAAYKRLDKRMAALIQDGVCTRF